MNKLQQLLETEPYLLLDGALGTMLMAAGLSQGNAPELWNEQHPERVQAVHGAYIAAGSRLILTNTFGGTRFRLRLHDLQERAVELNQVGAALARREAAAAPHPVLVAGSMGPTGELLAPLGAMTMAQAQAAFAEQAQGLVAGGVDVLWIETMSDLNEVQAAVDGIRSVCDLPICATMTFDTHGRTMMGVTPAQAVARMQAWGLTAVGCNCGSGVEEIETVVAAMHQAAPQMPLIAKSNAGIPEWIDQALVYSGTPAVMARYARRVRALGARLIGGCCGSSPAHITAMEQALKRPLTTDEQAAIRSEVMAGSGENGRKRHRRHQRNRP